MAISPIVSSTIQATLLAVLSNLSAQVITASQAPFNTSSPPLYSSQWFLRPTWITWTPIFRFALYAALSTPPNFLWQEFLESILPGHDVKPKVVVADDSSTKRTGVQEKPMEIVPQKKLNWRNTFLKLVIDQSLGASMNTVAFLAVMEAMKGGSMEMCLAVVRENYWPLMSAGLRLWPMVSLLSFTVIPVQQRVTFGAVVGVGWGIFLSLVSV